MRENVGHTQLFSEGHAHFCNSDVHVQRTLKMAQGLLQRCVAMLLFHRYLHYSDHAYGSGRPPVCVVWNGSKVRPHATGVFITYIRGNLALTGSAYKFVHKFRALP